MTLKLRISSRDGRALAASMPYALIDRSDNSLVSTHSSYANCTRAMITLQHVASSTHAWALTAAALHEIISDTCEQLHQTRNYASLFGQQQAQLINAVHRELRSQRGS